MTSVGMYLETGKADCGLQAQLGQTIFDLDLKGLRMCQLYFVLQQMLKVIFASLHKNLSGEIYDPYLLKGK
jgi:hypothetical protein